MWHWQYKAGMLKPTKHSAAVADNLKTKATPILIVIKERSQQVVCLLIIMTKHTHFIGTDPDCVINLEIIFALALPIEVSFSLFCEETSCFQVMFATKVQSRSTKGKKRIESWNMTAQDLTSVLFLKHTILLHNYLKSESSCYHVLGQPVQTNLITIYFCNLRISTITTTQIREEKPDVS